MARGGYKFFDTDAHVGPYVDVLEPYLTADDKTRLAKWEQFRTTSRSGHISYNKGQRTYQRRLYTETAEPAASGYMAGFTGVARKKPINPDVNNLIIDFDGRDHLTQTVDYETTAWKRIKGNDYEVIRKKAGKIVLTSTNVLSKDGKTMTITTKGHNGAGEAINNVRVYEKQ